MRKVISGSLTYLDLFLDNKLQTFYVFNEIQFKEKGSFHFLIFIQIT